MDQRKLIKLGNSSFAIALPKEWVDKSGLKKGDNIFLERNSNGEIIVSPRYQKDEDKKVNISLKNKKEKEIEREIIATYIQGNNLFEIPVDSKKEIDIIKDCLKLLPSVEIMEYNNSLIIAKDLMDIKGLSMNNIMRRIDNITRSIFDDMELCVKTGNATQKQLSEILQADKEVNKFYFLLWKIMLKGLNNPSVLNALDTNYSNLVVNWWIGVSIERISDELKRIVRTLTKTKLDKSEIEFITSVYNFTKESYIDALNSYYKQDKESALEVAKHRDVLNEKYRKEFKNLEIGQIMDRFTVISSNIHNIVKSVLYFMEQNAKKR